MVGCTYPQFHLNSPSQYTSKASRITAEMEVNAFMIICHGNVKNTSCIVWLRIRRVKDRTTLKIYCRNKKLTYCTIPNLMTWKTHRPSFQGFKKQFIGKGCFTIPLSEPWSSKGAFRLARPSLSINSTVLSSPPYSPHENKWVQKHWLVNVHN